MASQIVNAMTEKQAQFIAALLQQQGKDVRRDGDCAGALGMTRAQWGRMTKVEASRIIDSLKK